VSARKERQGLIKTIHVTISKVAAERTERPFNEIEARVYSQYAKIGDEVDYLVDEEVLATAKSLSGGAIVKGKSFRLNTNADGRGARSTFADAYLGLSTVRVSVRAFSTLVAPDRS